MSDLIKTQAKETHKLKETKNKFEQEQIKNLARKCVDGTPYEDIVKFAVHEHQMSQAMANFTYEIHCFKHDGAYQLNRAVTQIVGVSAVAGEKTMSGPDRPIKTIDVVLSDGSRVKVPFGKIDLPDAGEEAYIKFAYDNDKKVLQIMASCQKKFSSMIDEIVELTKFLLNTDSIYKNQALELDSNLEPKIMDLSEYDNEPMILSKITKKELIPLMARIENPKKIIEKGIPLKTGILLEGGYGTGKTLLAFKTGREATKNNWVFIYLKDPSKLAEVLRMSKTLDKNGNGILVFVEDVDQVVNGVRDDAMQDILNTLDGGDTKQMNVVCVFTTNHIEKINPTFLRGKRIGSVVSMGYLDENTSEEYIKYFFPEDEYIIDSANMEEFYKTVAENKIVPAFMAEIVEKAKSLLIYEDSNIVNFDLLDACLKSYLRQVGLSQKKDIGKTKDVILRDALMQAVRDSIATELSEINIIKEQVC